MGTVDCRHGWEPGWLLQGRGRDDVKTVVGIWGEMRVVKTVRMATNICPRATL